MEKKLTKLVGNTVHWCGASLQEQCYYAQYRIKYYFQFVSSAIVSGITPDVARSQKRDTFRTVKQFFPRS